MTLARAMQIHLASLSAGHADFEDSMALVERYFHYTPAVFHNGPLRNEAGENEGSCKLFALAQHCYLSEVDTLACFGRHYRQVLDEPAGSSHANIRQFMGTGWSGIRFETQPLRPRPLESAEPAQEENA